MLEAGPRRSGSGNALRSPCRSAWWAAARASRTPQASGPAAGPAAARDFRNEARRAACSGLFIFRPRPPAFGIAGLRCQRRHYASSVRERAHRTGRQRRSGRGTLTAYWPSSARPRAPQGRYRQRRPCGGRNVAGPGPSSTCPPNEGTSASRHAACTACSARATRGRLQAVDAREGATGSVDPDDRRSSRIGSTMERSPSAVVKEHVVMERAELVADGGARLGMNPRRRRTSRCHCSCNAGAMTSSSSGGDRWAM